MRTGAALPMVLLALAMVAALTVGGSFVTRRYESDARLVQSASEIVPALEEALVRAAAVLDTAQLRAMGAGESAVVATPVTSGSTALTLGAWITRLNSENFTLVCEAETVHKPLLVKRLRLAIRLDSTGVHVVPDGGWALLP